MPNKEISVRDIESPVKLFADNWSLIAAGDENNHNCMTASWGAVGRLWNKDVAIIFIRPQRYTYEFTEACDKFTINFLDEKYRDALNFCGKASGRDGDKFLSCGITPQYVENTTAVSEAKYSLICKKIAYEDMIPEGFIADDIKNNYQNNDYHRIYVGEIIKVLSE